MRPTDVASDVDISAIERAMFALLDEAGDARRALPGLTNAVKIAEQARAEYEAICLYGKQLGSNEEARKIARTKELSADTEYRDAAAKLLSAERELLTAKMLIEDCDARVGAFRAVLRAWAGYFNMVAGD